MSRAEHVIAIALPFVWFGLIVGISTIETPLKFRAPGITTPLALGIGRLVFRALNAVELVLAVALAIVVAHTARDWPLAIFCVVAALLLVQVFVLRPRLDARALRVIAGDDVPPSRLHVAYIALEGAKLVLLPALGAELAWRWLG
ncbi:MAG: hypothetical protein QOD65_575 [Gaiellales bacterium]|nr:hypothetical protein [Gaiellales bacterium]